MNDKLVEKKLNAVLLKSAELLVENGLGDWRVDFNNSRSSLAETHFSIKTIKFSKHFAIVATEEQVVGVTLHEATHALLGKGHGHDNEFKKLCKEISPNGDYAKSSVEIHVRKYMVSCPECGYRGSSNSNKDKYCGRCFKSNEKTVKFNIEPNIQKVIVW